MVEFHSEGSLVLDVSQINQIKSEAIFDYPNEAVWLLTSSGVFRVSNVAENKNCEFEVDRKTYLEAIKHGLKAVIHSHTDIGAYPSHTDMKSQLAMGLPWGIISTNGHICSDIQWLGADEKAPLIGRKFVHGITDCYALIKDYYKLKLCIELPEYPRSWEWWLQGDNLYLNNFSHAGFVKIDKREATVGDMWVAQIRSKVPNHAGVLDEDGLLLHHPANSKPIDTTALSRREPASRWTPYIVAWYRHKDKK